MDESKLTAIDSDMTLRNTTKTALPDFRELPASPCDAHLHVCPTEPRHAQLCQRKGRPTSSGIGSPGNLPSQANQH